MITPKIIYETANNHGSFNWQVPANSNLKLKDFVVNIPAATEPFTAFTVRQENRGWIAVRHEGKWKLEDASVSFGDYLYVQTGRYVPNEAMAFPVDPAMTRQDIEGATRIYENADRTGWLFAHATKEEHIDRMFLGSTAMASLFDNVMEDKLQQTLAAIVNNNQSNQQRGYYINWAHLHDFKKECVAYCHKFEKLLYIGQHKHQEGLDLRSMLLRCVKHIKAEWEKAEKYDAVSGDVNSIIAHLETDHTFETRWEQAARHKAEAAARETSETENQ